MVASFVFLAAGLVLLTLFLIDKCKKYSVRETAIKATTSVCFVGVAASSYYMSMTNGQMNTFGIFVIVGLLFGLLGDIWLHLKYVFKEEDSIFTKLGFLVFGIGHVFYISGMISNFYNGENVLYLILPIVVAILSVGFVLILEKPMKVKYGSLKPVVIAYSFILFLMMSYGISFAIMKGFENWTLNFMAIGGILFVASDLILSGTYFGEGKDRPIDIVINSVLYYIAQFVIAFSLLMQIL